MVTCLPSSVRMIRSLCDEQPRQSHSSRGSCESRFRVGNLALEKKPRHRRQSNGAQKKAAVAASISGTETERCDENGGTTKFSDLSCTPSTTPAIHFKLVTFNQTRAVTCTFDMLPGCPSAPRSLVPAQFPQSSLEIPSKSRLPFLARFFKCFKNENNPRRPESGHHTGHELRMARQPLSENRRRRGQLRRDSKVKNDVHFTSTDVRVF
jgi:hypothetical protein